MRVNNTHPIQHSYRALAARISLLCCGILTASLPLLAQTSQLPEGASVSALGRTAKVRANGSFTISSVPANLGNFRIRLVGGDGTKAFSVCLMPVLNGFTVVPS